MYTKAEEDYLKAIFSSENKGDKKSVSTNLIAEKMGAKASSVTDMLKKLADKSLISYKKYQGVTLTEGGRDIALNIVRKHRLWETFLVELLHFSWDEVHEVAEQLEHIKSEKLIDNLDAFLGYPKKDPHGDPIPDRHGNIKTVDSVVLLELTKNQSGVFSGVKDSSDKFLKYLTNKSLSLGDIITVTSIEPFDDSMDISTDKSKFTVTKEIAKNILVQL